MSGVRVGSGARDAVGNRLPDATRARVPEVAALASLGEDVTAEPEALVRTIISEHLDYRELLTADWTVGRAPIDLSYRTQFFMVPLYPPGASGSPASAHRIRASTFDPLSSWWLTDPATQSTLSGHTPFGFQAADLRTARPMSGLLTQAAFLAPAGYKVRSISARILRTFTCGDVSGFQPDAGAMAIHRPFVPTSEPTAASHLDPTAGCLACHINLDPLASALSSSYLETQVDNGRTVQRLAAGGELTYYSTGDLLSGMTYGLRGVDSPSAGALMGHSVHGVREVGAVLANSRVFARCAVRHAFEGAFGRLPAGDAEQALLEATTDRFMGTQDWDYDAMVRDLVLSPEFEVTP
jgi:hypothetical protein